ncbi:MAG: purine-nucleoside phosphorylase [Candidatus Omnitrophica bacterium]|nr:purine-nucleoside phosphorylase [Candidatus Omnitrophota bacterium]
MKTLRDQIKETVQHITGKTRVKPKIGIILGTGLGKLAEEVVGADILPYHQLPHFPESTVVSHKGELIFGTISGKSCCMMEGRFHFYEGYTLAQATFPVRVMKALGVEILIISNAAGGMNRGYEAGDLVAITDHINLMGANPLIGPNDDALGPRFPDMCRPYDKGLIRTAKTVAKEEGLTLKEGVYVAVSGPNLETRAEYRFLSMIGADCVGMSTVPEVIVAVHAGLRTFAVSCITDTCFPETLEPVDIEKILRVAGEAEPRLARLVSKLIAKL